MAEPEDEASRISTKVLFVFRWRVFLFDVRQDIWLQIGTQSIYYYQSKLYRKWWAWTWYASYLPEYCSWWKFNFGYLFNFHLNAKVNWTFNRKRGRHENADECEERDFSGLNWWPNHEIQQKKCTNISESRTMRQFDQICLWLSWKFVLHSLFWIGPANKIWYSNVEPSLGGWKVAIKIDECVEVWSRIKAQITDTWNMARSM